MVVLLDEQFLVHSAVHRAVLRLLRNCAGDDLQEQLDGKNKVMGAARNVIRSPPSEYEEDCEFPHTVCSLMFSTLYSGQFTLYLMQPNPHVSRVADDILPRQALVSIRTAVRG